MGKHLAIVGRENAFLTGRNLQLSQAEGEAAIWEMGVGEGGRKRD